MEALEFNSNINSTLECPICMNYLSPPVIQCCNGHSICGKCSSMTEKCPECRIKLNQANRNLTLEKILEGIQLKCQFEECQVVTSLAKRSQHMDECPFNPYLQCVIEQCQWVGKEEDLLNHLKRTHCIKEFVMDPEGGFRGWNSKSWKQADWGYSIWNFNGEVILNKSMSTKNFFYLSIYDLGQQHKVKLTVENKDNKVSFVLSTGSIKNRHKDQMQFHLSIQEIQKHFLEAAEGLEDGYQRLTIKVQLLN